MTRLSDEQAARQQQLSQGSFDLDVDLSDGMSASASDSWKTGPTAAIGRGIRSLFDGSEKLSAAEANALYGLGGTEAEFKEGDNITADSARAKSTDFHENRLNDLITSSVNNDSPYMGRITQFGASMATSMVDPAMLAINVTGAGLISSGMSSVARGGRMLNFAAKSPALAQAIVRTYGDDVARGFSQIVAREAVENVVTGVAEEAISHAADLGNDRLARKTQIMDRVQNVVAGTFLGTGFGLALSKEGRSAIGKLWARDFGDDALDFHTANNLIQQQEAHMGIEASGIGAKIYDRETFGYKPWYNHTDEAFDAKSTKLPETVFMPLNDMGHDVNISNRGDGYSLTSSRTHAYNKGQTVIEIKTDNLRIMNHETFVDAKGRSTKIGSEVISSVADDIVARADPLKLTRIMAMLKDPEADITDMPALNRNQLRKIIREELNGKGIDGITKLADDIAGRHELDIDIARKLEDTADKLGFHGYQFTGKNAAGEGAYHGIYVTDKANGRIQRVGQIEPPKATKSSTNAGSHAIWKVQEEEMYKKHARWLQHEARSIKGDPLEAAGYPKETPLDTTPSKSAYTEALAATKEKAVVVDQVIANLQKDIEKAGDIIGGEAGDALNIKKQTLDLLQRVKNGEDPEVILKGEAEKSNAYLACTLNNLG